MRDAVRLEGANATQALIPLLHKRNLRAQMLNGPPDSAIARHNPVESLRP